jgi:hypothetical protein
MRMIPTPPRPGAVAMAAIGEESVFIVSTLKTGFITVDQFSHALSLLWRKNKSVTVSCYAGSVS